MEGLKPKPHPGRKPKMTQEHDGKLLETIQISPRELGKNFSNWSTPNLAKHLKATVGLCVVPSTIWRHLQALLWVFRRPVRTVISPDPRYKAKRKYLKALKSSARRGKIKLYFSDAFDIELLPTIGGCWMPKGVQYKIPTPGRNERSYGFGAVDYIAGRLLWLLSDHKDNVAFRKLLKQILEAHQGGDTKIVVVVDNYKPHKAKKVLEFLANNRKLRLYFLPTYSPKLNPIERLWKHFRRNVTDNFFFGTMSPLLEATGSFLQELAQDHIRVLSIINKPA
jgi:transposase